IIWRNSFTRIYAFIEIHLGLATVPPRLLNAARSLLVCEAKAIALPASTQSL
ncbi:MAG: hypothetical protein F6K30_06540, partial [Cyanothece sp. SIO2G6]|nr:hypothetical protein [Cyanothece sp. SIO2G6]